MKIVCISDTHGMHRQMTHLVPNGDILIHAGDFTLGQDPTAETQDFGKWLGEQPHRFKLVIAGNHDRGFEEEPEKYRRLLANCHYLENDWIIIKGIKFYGAPQTPRFMDWAFNVDRGESIAKFWRRIPRDTRVLITHGPAYGKRDQTRPNTEHLGDEELDKWLENGRNKVQYHIFGHIHGGHGRMEDRIVRVNAAICNEAYRPVNKPIVLEI